MPVYTCTTAQDTLTATTKAAFAAAITEIHCRVNHVPSAYVNVVFHELPSENVYTDAVPAAPLIVNGWTRTGHPQDQTTQLIAEVADAATRTTGVESHRVLVVIAASPARFAMEGGRFLPEPGSESTWLTDQTNGA